MAKTAKRINRRKLVTVQAYAIISLFILFGMVIGLVIGTLTAPMTEDYFTYENSDLRKALNGEILARFPEEIRSRMVALNGHGDLLRIPTEREIFGENVYGQPDGEKQWKCMKKCRNRIAFQGKEAAWEWYWLMNRHKDSASFFAIVSYDGNAAFTYASNSRGVRPVFLLS